jgi:hypothetical protein
VTGEAKQWGELAAYREHQDVAVRFGTARRFRFRTNAFGLRSSEIAERKTPAVTRILVVGDSYVEGFGADEGETFPQQLQRLFACCSRRRVEIVNAGLTGRHLRDYLDVLRHYLPRLAPDIVVLVPFSGNDLDPRMLDHERTRRAVSYGIAHPRAMGSDVRSFLGDRSVHVTSPRLARLDLWLWNTSRLYAATSSRLTATPAIVHAAARAGLLQTRPFEPVRLPLGEVDQALYLEPLTPLAERVYEEARRVFAEIVRVSREGGRPFVVINLPEKWKHPAMAGQSDRHLAGRPGLDRDRVHRFFRQLNLEHGVPFVDLEPVYLSTSRGDYLRPFTYDGAREHFSPRDNLMLALVALDLLVSENLVKPGEFDRDVLRSTISAGFGGADVIVPFTWY